jgi:ADP-ribose pyrophosphatase YjhB (NUDIX family)
MILFIDTSGERNRLALFSATGEQVAERELPARGTSEVILAELETLLKDAGKRKEDLTGIAVVIGPGSYTGLRVGLSFGNALALGLELPMLGMAAGADPSVEISKGKFEKQWLRPDYGGEAHVTVKDPLARLGDAKTAVGIAFIREREVLLGLRLYEPEPLWTVPGGRGSSNETLEQTLRREVKEETGIERFEVTGFLGTVPGAHPGDTFYFVRGETTQEPQLLEPELFREWRWVAKSDRPDAFINEAAWKLVEPYLSD